MNPIARTGAPKTVPHSIPRAVRTPSRAATQRAAVSDKSSSFKQRLASAIQDHFGRTNSGGGARIDTRPAGGHNSGVRQFVATGRDRVVTAAAAAAAATAPRAAADAPMVIPTLFPDTGSPYNVPPPSMTRPYRNSADAYWAAQPPEVQAMRAIPENNARDAKAHELAARGFTIDYPIMVWGWDPLSTMRMRINSGYTWVPAVGQTPVEVTPGATFPGKTTYDPRNPPPGSIPVSTAFADGYDV